MTSKNWKRKPSGGFAKSPFSGKAEPQSIEIYGLHAAEAALANPERGIISLHVTPNAASRLEPLIAKRGLRPAIVLPKDLDRRLGEDAVHQGVLLEAAPLAPLELEDLGSARLVIVLDQVTDPHNAGAVLRSGAAFGADAMVMTAHHSPRLSGVMAKAASGALEWVRLAIVPNLAQAMAKLGDMGFYRIGFDSGADALGETDFDHDKLALVFGAEDKGLRRLTREHCDKVAALETAGKLRSLNVSNAAAIGLYLAFRRRPA